MISQSMDFCLLASVSGLPVSFSPVIQSRNGVESIIYCHTGLDPVSSNFSDTNKARISDSLFLNSDLCPLNLCKSAEKEINEK